MNSELTQEQIKALEENAGFMVGPSYVIMSKNVYHQTMGIDSAEEFKASIKAINHGIKEIEEEKTRNYQEFLAELKNDHDV